MGVYLPNVDMPKGAKVLTIQICPDGSIWQQYRGTVPNAKAVPVPPHGRLGDLAKLVEKIDGIWDCNDMVFKPNDHCCNVPEDCKGCKWAQTKDCIQRMVENAPTIIPAEEGET